MNTFQKVNNNHKFNELTSKEKLAVAWWVDVAMSGKSFLLMK